MMTQSMANLVLAQAAAASESLRLGDPGVEFGFAYPLPAWAWALVVSAALGIAALSYHRLEGALWGRAAMALLRAITLVALVVLLCGPRLAKPNETEEKDWVLALVDRSGSLAIPDAPGQGAQREAREAQLRRELEQAAPAWKKLSGERVVKWIGFDAGAYELPVDAATGMPRLDEPGGRRTDIERAIDQALRKAAARPVSGIVLLSDGRSVSEPSKALVRRLEAEKVPVFVLPLGSAEPVGDVAITRTEAPRSAFMNDLVPVQVELEHTPEIEAARAAGRASVVELVDQSTGAVLDTREVDWDAAAAAETAAGGATGTGSTRQRLTLTGKPTAVGAGRWSIRVRGSGDEPDMIAENNTAEVAIELVDRPLRVALFDGYPRWEYRYLTSLLVRESSIASTIMLLAPGRRYVQEGTVVLDNLPRTPEQWAQFDVIIMGDVVPGVFTADQMEQIKRRVAVGGAGLIWIAGESAVPERWRGAPLADLLPISLSDSGASAGGDSSGVRGEIGRFEGPVVVRPTPAADRLGVLRLSEREVDGGFWPRELSDPATGWSQLFWVQRIAPRDVKAAVEVLATATPIEGDTGSTGPAVLSMRFGAGRSLYVATDEIWRWRYGRGEPYTERFWLQLIRLLGRESLTRSGRPAAIEATPARAEVGQTVRVVLTLLDQALVEGRAPSLPVRIVPTGDAAAAVELTLRPEDGTPDAAAAGAGATRTYAGTWLADRPGTFAIEATDPLLSPGGGRTLRTEVDVRLSDDELRVTATDHDLLARLAEQTGGQVLSPGGLSKAAELLPNRRVRISGEPEVRTLWDRPWVLGLMMALITLEWVGRRLLRLA